jgi:shikimate kinase
MMVNKTIFLIGMMGCGKSTLGALLAQQFDLPFLDIDAAIEQREGRSISQLFGEQGEGHFRQLEQQVLDELPGGPQIVACGGGLPFFEDNLWRMKQKGLVVYLEVPSGVLYARIQDALDRPLLKDWPAFEQLFIAREACYRGADIIINANLQPAEILLEFEQLLEQ